MNNMYYNDLIDYDENRNERIPNEEGESIEEYIRRLTETNQGIPQDVTPIYTEAKDGALPEYDIRTDRFELANKAVDKYTASAIAHASEGQEEQEVTKEKDTTNTNKE